MIKKMSSNCLGSDLKITAVKIGERVKKQSLTGKEETHLEKRTKNKNWDDVEVEENKEENHETRTAKFKCDQCSYAATRNYHLNRHKIARHKLDEDIEWYKCPKCPKKLKLKGQLKQHLQNAHDEVKKWFTCTHCPFKTKTKRYLTNHEITRHAPSESIKWFHCTQCDDYKARTKELLQRHVKRKHEQFFFSRDYCAYISKGSAALNTHEITEHKDCIKWMKCDQCGNRFKDEARLRSHKRTHETDEFNERMNAMPVTSAMDVSKAYSCSVCNFKTLDRVEFDKHIHKTQPDQIHLEKRKNNKHWADVEVEEEQEENSKTRTAKFKCDQCSYAATRNYHLNRHKIARHKLDEDIEWYKCPKCPKKLKIKEELRVHLQRIHDEVKEWFTCAHCPFKTKTKRYLTNHEITRHAPSESIKWFHCTQCDDYKARTKEQLQRHVKRKHEQLFFSCDYCAYISKGSVALKTHEITEHKDCIKWMKCDQCGNRFKDEARLRSHKRTHETDEFNERMNAMPVTSAVDVSKAYSCSVCMFKTLDRVEFDKHIHKTQPDQIHLEKRKNNKHWADVEVEEEQEENPKTQRGKFKCDQCSYATNRNSSLKTHRILRHNSEEYIAWYKCPKCPKKLKLKGQLKQHLQNAHDEVKKLFSCAHCSFKTKLKSSLTSHEITRHAPSESIKWFHCTQCHDYKGRTKQLLQLHVKRKHDQFFFNCDYCSYKSKCRVALKTHEIAEHEDCIKWSKCDQCEDKFKDERSLMIHIKRAHRTGEFNERLGIADNLMIYSCSVCTFKTLERVEFAKHSHQDSTKKRKRK